MRGDETSFFYAVLVKGGSSQYALAAIFILESTNYSKEFIDIINCMSGKYSRWAIFQDLITMMAISMANACDKRQAKEREDEYMSIIHRYNKSEQETFPEMLGIIVSALEQNPDQDFLGDIYMQLSLADKMKAQYKPILDEKSEKLSKQYGTEVHLSFENDKEFMEAASKNLERLENQYQQTVRNAKAQLKQMIG